MADDGQFDDVDDVVQEPPPILRKVGVLQPPGSVVEGNQKKKGKAPGLNKKETTQIIETGFMTSRQWEEEGRAATEEAPVKTKKKSTKGASSTTSESTSSSSVKKTTKKKKVTSSNNNTTTASAEIDAFNDRKAHELDDLRFDAIEAALLHDEYLAVGLTSPLSFSSSSMSTSLPTSALTSRLNLSAHTQNDITSAEKKGEKRANYYGKDDRATSEQVLDPRTRLILFKLLSSGFLSEIDGCLSTGKEANVYYARGREGREFAVKIFKTSILVSNR